MCVPFKPRLPARTHFLMQKRIYRAVHKQIVRNIGLRRDNVRKLPSRTIERYLFQVNCFRGGDNNNAQTRNLHATA
jgi:hypothetical protein